MKPTNDSNIGWVVVNGSGWNHHKTADTLNDILASSPDELPTVPNGYGVLVAPISDKPFGLRCALVKVLPRRMEPSVSIHTAGGNYAPTDFSNNLKQGLEDDYTVESSTAHLISKGYQPTTDRPAGWPSGMDWFRHADGTWASMEMLDDGADGDADGWAAERFDMDVERIHSVKAEQQSDDDSAYFIRVMREQIAKL